MTNLQQVSVKICVYKITNPKGKIYIGSTISLRKRITAYRNLQCKEQHKLYNSFKKYGFDKHKIEIICECTKEDIRQKEAYYGHLYNCLSREGLNCRLPYHGEGFNSASVEWRIANGIRKKGNKYTLGKRYGEDVKRRMSIAQKLRPRLPHSEKTKQKMSLSALGGKNHKAKILLNLQTGIYYECVMDAANSYSMNYNTFRCKLYNHRNNNNDTPFIYV